MTKNSLLTAFEGSNSPVALTQNGARTLPSTGDRVLDFFSQAGALKDAATAVSMFEKAYNEHREMAVRALLWSRDIRGGAGRRANFRAIFLWLEKNDFDMFRLVATREAEFGRWDDLLIAVTDAGKQVVFALCARALAASDGLCAKWMPREGKKNSNIARELREYMGLTERQYRKLLVRLTNVVESQMTARQWSEINYNHVPSVAGKRYAKAFRKHDGERYQAWLDSLKTVDKTVKTKDQPKINVDALYPHDIMMSLRQGQATYAEAAWANMKDYVADTTLIMPVVDTSGSMTTHIQSKIRAMDVSVSLGLYLAERNKSAFRNRMITFNSQSQWIVVDDKMTLKQKLDHIERAPWGGSTNLQSTFDLLLDTAVKNKVPQSDMPTHIMIISDMEFNCVTGPGSSNRYQYSYSRSDRPTSENFSAIEQKYQKAGYTRPKVIFWNVNGREGNSPVHKDENGTILVSGFSPAILRSALSQRVVTPTDAMLETLMAERYNIFQ